MTVKVGQKVPDFVLEAYEDGEIKTINTTEYRGKWLVLFFYPRDFTFVCPTELKGFANAHKEFEKFNATVVGVSTDSEHSHKAWFEKDLTEIKYPVLADTSHALSRAFNVLLDDGRALRGTFIIDPDGYLQYIVVSNLNVGRSVGETLRVLQALQTGGLCPIEWKPGQKTL